MDLDTPIDRLKFYTLYAGMDNGTCVVNIQDVEDVSSELDNKDKIINSMAELIYKYINLFHYYEVGIDHKNKDTA